MDINSILSTCKRRLGLRYVKLPISDEDLIETLVEDSLTTFDTYFPQYCKITLDLNKDRISGIQPTFRINKELLRPGCKILSVEDITMDYYYNRTPYSGGVHNMMLSTMSANIDNLSNLPIIFEFYEPDIVIIDEEIMDYCGHYIMSLAISHDPSFCTIEETYKDAVLKLCLLDLKIFLYNNLKHFENVDTTFGQISLKLDEWNGAESDRETLLKDWDSVYLLDRQTRIYNI